ncbi:glucan-binding YG repeat protein [Aequitasia blattaphilus]
MQNYRQFDSRWGSKPYAGWNMTNAGCGPTATADILDKLPNEVADYMTGRGYAIDGQGTLWDGIQLTLQAYGKDAKRVSQAEWLSLMKSGKYEGILCMGRSKWTTSGHFITVVSVNSSNDCYVHDPAQIAEGWQSWSDINGYVSCFYVCRKGEPQKESRIGWIFEKANGWWYRNADGSYPKNKWEKIEGHWYLFDKKGYMRTGWVFWNKHWYYLNEKASTQALPNGALVKDWFWDSKRKRYYYLEIGTDAKGYPEGSMHTGWFKDLRYKAYYFLCTDAVVKQFNGKYKVGEMLVNEWLELGGKKYYFDDSGKMVTGEVTIAMPKKFRFDKDGALIE